MKNGEIDTENMDITPEMEGYFRHYLTDHQMRVINNAMALCDAGFIDSIVAVAIALGHDKNKLEPPEYIPYVKRKWMERNSSGERYRDMGDDVKRAIVHHVTTSPHHPEYWSDDYDGFETDKPCHVSDMPERYVIEMVCDWVAMGDEYGNTAREWYDKVKNSRWIFDKATSSKIEHWIDMFDKLDKSHGIFHGK